MNFNHDGVEVEVGWIPSSQDWAHDERGPELLWGTHERCYQISDFSIDDFHSNEEDEYGDCNDSGGDNNGGGDDNDGTKGVDDVGDDARVAQSQIVQQNSIHIALMHHSSNPINV